VRRDEYRQSGYQHYQVLQRGAADGEFGRNLDWAEMQCGRTDPRTSVCSAGVGSCRGDSVTHSDEIQPVRQSEISEGGDYSLSVVMPVHNEERTIEQAVAETLEMKLGHRFELIVVDDGSLDRTPDLLQKINDPRVVLRRHDANLGKGAAVLSGATLATGSHMVVFDADHEYRACDLVRMFEPIVEGRAEVVFGTRVFGINTLFPSFRYALGNRVTTFAANVLFGAYLTDLHTCLKMFPLPLFRQLHLKSAGFGLDSEITGELLRRGFRPFEVPVSYVGRSHAQGKQITWRDGFDCLAVLGRVRLRGRISPESLSATTRLSHGDLGAGARKQEPVGRDPVPASSDLTLSGSILPPALRARSRAGAVSAGPFAVGTTDHGKPGAEHLRRAESSPSGEGQVSGAVTPG
jgi:dolichol-phosphate hexosyltransferase